MQTNFQAVNDTVVAAVAAAARPSDWLALLDQQQHCIHLQRGALGDIPEKLIGITVGASKDLVSNVLHHGTSHQTERIFDDPQLGPRIFEYQFRPLMDASGVAAVVVRCNESTAQRAILQAARLQTHVLEALNDGILLVDANSIVRLFNPAAQQLLGSEGKPLVGKSLAEIAAPLASALQRANDAPVDLKLARGDQTAVFVECRARSLRIRHASYRLAILRDITERRTLERELIETEQRERERIGRELHDGLGQELTGLAMMLQAVATRIDDREPASAGQLYEAVGIVNTMIASARELAQGILAGSIPDQDLTAALQSLADRAATRSGIDVRFTRFGGELPALSDSAVGALFRIAQEATTNAMRHSGASAIDIILAVDNAGLSLSIADNGHGFRAGEGQSTGMGMRIMRMRANSLGAQFCMTPASRGGTRIECTLPKGVDG